MHYRKRIEYYHYVQFHKIGVIRNIYIILYSRLEHFSSEQEV